MAKKFPAKNAKRPIYQTITCQGCGLPKPISQFRKDSWKNKRYGPSQRDPLCKDCRRQAVRNDIRSKYFE